jgi:predicted nuclease of restriction endonuclease-like RecB superfamily
MLTRDLLRWRLSGEAVIPSLLRPTPGQLELAERLIRFWNGAIGSRRREIDEQLTIIMHQSRSLVVARGLSRMLEDAATFSEPEPVAELRAQAFAISSRLMAQPLPDADAHRAAVAQQLGVDAEALKHRLYCDLPEAALLEASPVISPRVLLERYNLSLCQGLLLGARALTVRIQDVDTALARRVLKALRWRRLLALVRQGAARELVLEISGPASVLDGGSRYGLQLALFLPELAACAAWELTSAIELPRRQGRGTLTLGSQLGLVATSSFLGYVPSELRAFTSGLEAKLSPWSCQEVELIPLHSGELVVPDLQLRNTQDGRSCPCELFHRFHADALARRLAQLAAGELPRLIIGVDRALSRSKAMAGLLEHPMFLRHGFSFSELPSPRALAERLRQPPGG